MTDLRVQFLEGNSSCSSSHCQKWRKYKKVNPKIRDDCKYWSISNFETIGKLLAEIALVLCALVLCSLEIWSFPENRESLHLSWMLLTLWFQAILCQFQSQVLRGSYWSLAILQIKQLIADILNAQQTRRITQMSHIFVNHNWSGLASDPYKTPSLIPMAQMLDGLRPFLPAPSASCTISAHTMRCAEETQATQDSQPLNY